MGVGDGSGSEEKTIGAAKGDVFYFPKMSLSLGSGWELGAFGIWSWEMG